MLKNYFIIAIRNLLKYKTYSSINILGLTLGIVSLLIVMLFIRSELSYDTFNEKSDRIYRLEHEEWAVLGTVYADLVHAEFPEVENVTRFDIWTAGTAVFKNEERLLKIENLVFADSSVFDIFTFPFIQGNPRNALTEPMTIVLTESTAKLIFGDENPIDRTLKYNNEFYFRVTGVIRDVENSHIPINAIAAFTSLKDIYHDEQFLSAFDAWNYPTFLLTHPDTDMHALEAKINSFFKQYKTFFWDENSGPKFHLKPLEDIYLYGDSKYGYGLHGSVQRILLVIFLAVFILLIASFNFVNLTTARASLRAGEVGMRKVLGAHRGSLIFQFLGESLVLCTIAFLLALAVVDIGIPYFNSLFSTSLSLNDFNLMQLALIAVVGISVLAVLAGIYPAIYLTAFNPATVLKQSKNKDRKSILFRRSLIVMQFSISSILIVGTFTIAKQLNYIRNKNLGFDKELVLTIPVNRDIKPVWQTFKNRLLSRSEISNVTFSHFALGEVGWIQTWDVNDEKMYSNLLFVDPEFVPMLGLEIAEGRNFSWDMTTDSLNSYVINEEAARHLGPEPVVGKKLGNGIIIGVVKDFHFNSLREKISPLVMAWESGNMQYANIKIYPHQIGQAITEIEKIWQEFSPEFPFEYSFLDKRIEMLYRSEQRLAHIFGAFSAMAVFIACIGLFGMSAFLVVIRTREIALRKIFGASVAQIIGMLSREFIWIVVFANVISWPVIYLVSDKLLQNFAYQTQINLWIYVVALVITLAFSFLTSCWQAIQAAAANPVDALQSE